jgi:hypothetical protein
MGGTGTRVPTAMGGIAGGFPPVTGGKGVGKVDGGRMGVGNTVGRGMGGTTVEMGRITVGIGLIGTVAMGGTEITVGTETGGRGVGTVIGTVDMGNGVAMIGGCTTMGGVVEGTVGTGKGVAMTGGFTVLGGGVGAPPVAVF